MSERDDLLASIADTIEDYREGEITKPTPDHVNRWVHQFDEAVQTPLLREIDYVFKQSYFSKLRMLGFFESLINQEKIAGRAPRDYWQAANLLDIQQHGYSQKEILELFGNALLSEYNLNIAECGSHDGPFIYLDDVLFSGGRVGADLSSWICDAAPADATLHIIVIGSYQLGEYQCTKRLKQVAVDAGKLLNLQVWAAIRLENRKVYRDRSETLWPAEVPEDQRLQAYMAEEHKFPFQPRQPGGRLEHAIFSSEEGRQLLERELLLAGMRIRSFSQNPNRALRPLGFSAFGLGFGATIITYRNCPNNCPLALWWGDPEAAPAHPFSRWVPLLPRKTYQMGIDAEDL